MDVLLLLWRPRKITRRVLCIQDVIITKFSLIFGILNTDMIWISTIQTYRVLKVLRIFIKETIQVYCRYSVSALSIWHIDSTACFTKRDFLRTGELWGRLCRLSPMLAICRSHKNEEWSKPSRLKTASDNYSFYRKFYHNEIIRSGGKIPSHPNLRDKSVGSSRSFLWILGKPHTCGGLLC